MALSDVDRHTLRQTPVLASLSPAAFDRLLDRGRVTTCPRGQLILRAGTPAEFLHVVLSGVVKVYHLSPRGEEQTLHRFGPGESFAEAALWAGDDYPANAAAIKDVRLWILPRSMLLEAIAREPELAMGLLAGMSAKLREFASLIEQLSLRQVPARLARALLAEAGERSAFRLAGSKRDLAARLGTTPESLSRALAKLKSAGLIDVAGSQITLLDRQGLAELVAAG